VIGCHAANIARESCEYDLLIVNRDPVPQKVVGFSGSYARLVFRNEFEIRDPRPALAVALASAVPLRDNSLLLASAISECRRNYSVNCRALTEAHLASSLKALGRVDELLAIGEVREADLWLLSAAYELAFANLLNFEIVPAPSHLLAQMKSMPAGANIGFKTWADAAALELASKSSCENRLESLSVIYDVLRTSEAAREVLQEIGRYQGAESFAVLKHKADHLIKSMQSVDCYCYLGWESVRSILDLYSLHTSRLSKAKDYTNTIRDLTIGHDRLISEEVVKMLGLVRTSEMVTSAKDALKISVGALAKTT
jgi:hypothetical protein